MSTAPLLIELGTEELPVKALPELAAAFADGVVAGLAKRGVTHGAAMMPPALALCGPWQEATGMTGCCPMPWGWVCSTPGLRPTGRALW